MCVYRLLARAVSLEILQQKAPYMATKLEIGSRWRPPRDKRQQSSALCIASTPCAAKLLRQTSLAVFPNMFSGGAYVALIICTRPESAFFNPPQLHFIGFMGKELEIKSLFKTRQGDPR